MKSPTTTALGIIAALVILGLGSWGFVVTGQNSKAKADLDKARQQLQQQTGRADQASKDAQAKGAENDKLKKSLSGLQATFAKRPGTDKPEAQLTAFLDQLQAKRVDLAKLYLENDSLLPAEWAGGIISYQVTKVDPTDAGASVFVRVRWTGPGGQEQVATWSAKVERRNDAANSPLWLITGLALTQPGS